MEQTIDTPRQHSHELGCLKTLSHRVEVTRELCQERNLTAEQCGCAGRCARCRTALMAATHLLRRALVELDTAQDQIEQGPI